MNGKMLTKQINELLPLVLDSFSADELFDFAVEETPIHYHFGLGTHLRNKMISVDSELFKRFRTVEILHHDDMSDFMLTRWQELLRLHIKTFLKKYIETGGDISFLG